MTFKSRRGEMPWYVIALVLALIVLAVSLFIIPKIRSAGDSASSTITDACAVAGGTCTDGTECTSGVKLSAAPCTDGPNKAKRVCCKA
jgi:hypothetical protein